MKTEIESADQALALIQQRIAQGLTPVHHGTSFYRYNFSKSQFGSCVFYLDERGTVGRCQYQNVERVFDFVDMGLPVPGYLFEVRVPRTAPVAIAVVVAPAGGPQPPGRLGSSPEGHGRGGHRWTGQG